MKYRFIDEQRGCYRVEKMARTLGVSRAGYYEWRRHGETTRDPATGALVERITRDSRKGEVPVWVSTDHKRAGRGGDRVGHNHVARLMRAQQLGGRPESGIARQPTARTSSGGKELAESEFQAPAANRVWCSDISYIATAEGWLYLCVVIDLYSRKVVGWSMSRTMKAWLVVQALLMAMMRRGWPRGVIFHSDRGSQYASQAVRRRLERHGLLQSMSRKGECWDNAPTETFFSTLKRELCGDRAFATRAEARGAIFEYLEIFYNRVRLHSTNGYLTPAEYEGQAERWQHEQVGVRAKTLRKEGRGCIF